MQKAIEFVRHEYIDLFLGSVICLLEYENTTILYFARMNDFGQKKNVVQNRELLRTSVVFTRNTVSSCTYGPKNRDHKVGIKISSLRRIVCRRFFSMPT
ncbi:hypothetical protein L6452_04742 [Arctium lappa]|uniref:Uncharacterized protein n=1 Tax=Arctium lappa TaxID=4217 RepID=A0ACB9EDX0_ARCLA|nr:hypothetical protein L6452_04742 [Arctium lappa]